MAQQPKKKDDWFDQFEEDTDYFGQFESADNMEIPITEPEPSTWGKLNTPLTTRPSEIGRDIAKESFFERRKESDNPLWASLMGFYEGATEGIGDTLSSLTSPVNLATTLTTMGAGGAAKLGLGQGARALQLLSGALSAPVAAHGTYETFRPGDEGYTPESLPRRAFGVAEMAGGAAGMKYGFTPKKINPAVTDRLLGLVEPTNVTEPRIKIDPAIPYRTGTVEPITKSILTDSGGKSMVSNLELPKIRKLKLIEEPFTREIDAKYVDTVTGEELSLDDVKKLTTVKPGKLPKNIDYELTDSAGKSNYRISPYETQSTKIDRNTVTPEQVLDLTSKTNNPPETWKEILSLPKGLRASLDLSFGGRQGLGLIHTKSWWTNMWKNQVKSLGSEKAYTNIMDEIKSRPNFTDGTYKRAGLKIGDLNELANREEAIMSTLAEKIPLVGKPVRASNRAYTAGANTLRTDNFDNLLNQAVKIYETAKVTGKAKRGFFTENFSSDMIESLDPRKNDVLLRQIGDFVNSASGRGSLGQYEGAATALNATMFSPRLMASRLQYMNPKNYINTNPFVRKQYLKSIMGMATAWTTMAGMAKLAGADVSLDPDSTDFGKIKIGDTRIDPAGGFQQYLVLLNRMKSGQYASSTSNKTTEYGSTFGAKARLDALIEFITNKLAPIPSYGARALGATSYRPFNPTDETAKLFTPMIIEDLIELSKEDPDLIPLIIPSIFGVGTQTYGQDNRNTRMLPEVIPEFPFKGGRIF